MSSNTEHIAKEWFERVWHYREEVLYPSLFGSNRRGIYTIKAEMLTGMFKQESFDPRWLFHGVFAFDPTPTRASWLYVTSGMSNDWDATQADPSTPSGLGCEFVFEITQRSDWAVVRLVHLMAFQILLCHGRYPGREPLRDFDRVPLREPICPGQSVLTNLMLAPPSRFVREVQLESGQFDFYQIVGISEKEAAYARAHDGTALMNLLSVHNVVPITDPARGEVVADD